MFACPKCNNTFDIIHGSKIEASLDTPISVSSTSEEDNYDNMADKLFENMGFDYIDPLKNTLNVPMSTDYRGITEVTTPSETETTTDGTIAYTKEEKEKKDAESNKADALFEQMVYNCAEKCSKGNAAFDQAFNLAALLQRSNVG